MTATIKRRLPTIIGAGPGRTGTTWLHRVLEGRVDLPYGVKETQFFSTYYDKGIDWYSRHFRYATGERTIAEICPYLFHPLAPDRIKTHIPNCRVITTLRSPIDHSFSAYKLVTHYAWARGSFDEVLKSRPNLGGGNRYAFHLRKWFENFGRENVLVTMYDELRADPQKYLDQVTDFIGVERIALSARPEIGTLRDAPDVLAQGPPAIWCNKFPRAQRRLGFLPRPRRTIRPPDSRAGRASAPTLPPRSRSA